MVSGIYKITNTFNNKSYIGSSCNIERRFKEHLNMLQNNRHDNPHIQNCYNKYHSKFKLEILATCPKEYLIKLEQKFLNKFNPEYNICKIAGAGNIPNKEITQYNLKGEKIKDWYSIREASIALNIKESGISGVCRKIKKKAGGYIFTYKGETCSPYCRKSPKPHIKKGLTKKVNQYTLDNIFVKQWDSIKEASINLNLDSSGISKVCKGKIKYIKTYIFRYG